MERAESEKAGSDLASHKAIMTEYAAAVDARLSEAVRTVESSFTA